MVPAAVEKILDRQARHQADRKDVRRDERDIREKVLFCMTLLRKNSLCKCFINNENTETIICINMNTHLQYERLCIVK